ncbi:hypothetical protein [Corynebacterium uberis]
MTTPPAPPTTTPCAPPTNGPTGVSTAANAASPPLPLPLFGLGGGGLHHSLEPLQHEAIAAVITALGGTCAGDFVTEPDGAIRWQDTVFQDGL